MNRLRASVIAHLLAIVAIVGSIDGHLILCVEADGRISIELAGAGCCNPTGLETQHRDLPGDLSQTCGAASTSNSCTRCTDLPLATATSGELVSRNFEQALHGAPRDLLSSNACALTFIGAWADAPVSRINAPGIDTQSAALVHQRTIVLRC